MAARQWKVKNILTEGVKASEASGRVAQTKHESVNETHLWCISLTSKNKLTVMHQDVCFMWVTPSTSTPLSATKSFTMGKYPTFTCLHVFNDIPVSLQIASQTKPTLIHLYKLKNWDRPKTLCVHLWPKHLYLLLKTIQNFTVWTSNHYLLTTT